MNRNEDWIYSNDIGEAKKLLSQIKFELRCKTPNQIEFIKHIKTKELVICSGPPGTGKTFLACGQALKLLKSSSKPYEKIVLVKSVTTLKQEEIGFLKGGLKEKMDPFMYSFFHNFEKLVGKANLEKLKNFGVLEVLPIAYFRGINLDNSIIIIDEAQNISTDNIRTVMTRLGKDSKMIFLGDENQIDLKNSSKSSLSFLVEKFSDVDPSIGTVQFTNEDIVRNPLIKKIENVFNSIN